MDILNKQKQDLDSIICEIQSDFLKNKNKS